MKKTYLIATLSLILAAAGSPSHASGIALPLPSEAGYTAVAGWGGRGTFAFDPEIPIADQLTANAGSNFWASNSPTTTYATASISGSGNFVMNSNLASVAAPRDNKVNASNVTYTLSTTNYTGPAFGSIKLQATIAGAETLFTNSIKLLIGGHTLALDSYEGRTDVLAIRTKTAIDPEHPLSGEFDVERYMNQSTNISDNVRYVEYTWDVSGLNLTEADFQAWSINFGTGSGGHIYDVQIAVQAIPEPSSILLMGGGLAVAAVLASRKRSRTRLSH